MPLKDRTIESSKPGFSPDGLLRARELSWQALRAIARRMHVGISEDEANRIALDAIRELGGEKNWHRPHVRFGENTLLSFRGVSKTGTILGESDIYFIDIGPVFGGYEGDVGDTFVTGSDAEMHRCARDCRALFEDLREHWRAGRTGEELYMTAASEACKRGWQLNLDAAGHRVADFPHHLYYKGGMRELAFSPVAHAWILEVQIRHPEKPFGAFYEDLLF